MNKIHTHFDEMWQLDLYSIVRTILLSDIFRYVQIQLLENSDIKSFTLYEFESIKQSKIAMVLNEAIETRERALKDIKEIAKILGKRIPFFETEQIARDLQAILTVINEVLSE